MRASEILALAVEARGRRRMASGQRGANGHPGGSAASDGGAPGIGTTRPAGRSAGAAEPSNPTV